MAADGLTSPQIALALFVTQKTVAKHLANACSRLGIRSRVELPGALTVGP
jgi:DNA-binding NarL/FixJ family response regulator